MSNSVLNEIDKLRSAIHRVDYQRILHEEALCLGVKIRLGCDVLDVQCSAQSPTVHLSGGEPAVADVVIGADGEILAYQPH